MTNCAITTFLFDDTKKSVFAFSFQFTFEKTLMKDNLGSEKREKKNILAFSFNEAAFVSWVNPIGEIVSYKRLELSLNSNLNQFKIRLYSYLKSNLN